MWPCCFFEPVVFLFSGISLFYSTFNLFFIFVFCFFCFCLHLNSELSLTYSTQSTVSSLIFYLLRSVGMLPIVELLQLQENLNLLLTTLMGCYLSLWLCGPYFTYPLKQPYSWPLSQPERLARSWHLVVLKSLVKVTFWIFNLDCLRELHFQCLRSHPSSGDWNTHLYGLSLDGYLPFGRLQLISTVEVVLEHKLQDSKTSH